ncbi:MAG: Gfo/Idh/MocA family oxidoreductase, partial [Candidatus Marinimicrobia bacterium]|nr:Gfo/Idh/MocA family oxidoreductase [Candidatus Neomarinimicrobiota bacterium]
MMKVALVGCGRISKRHVEAISETKGIEITMVCDIIEERAKALAEKLGLPYVCDYKKIRGVDVISVLTPSGDHPRHAAEIAETSDASYIVCEKPISLTVREADELFKRVDKAGKVLLPVYQNRYNPLIVMIK